MNSNLKMELYRAATLTFEELCFMVPSPELEEELREAPVEAEVRVAFRGPWCGKLILRARGGLLESIASNMLGDDVQTEQQQRDALGEIANVVCGNVLPAIAGLNEEFHLDPPLRADGRAASSDETDVPAAEVHVILDQGRADLLLVLDDDATLGGRDRDDSCAHRR